MMRPAIFADAKPGAHWVADGRFPCLPEGKIVEVEDDPDGGGMFVQCEIGRHMLSGSGIGFNVVEIEREEA
jgi:hypothetical protein